MRVSWDDWVEDSIMYEKCNKLCICQCCEKLAMFSAKVKIFIVVSGDENTD